MRPFQTVAQVLLVTFLAHSTLAAPAPAPKETHETRALGNGLKSWGKADVKEVLKENTVAGIINGIYASLFYPFFVTPTLHNLSRRAFDPESLHARTVSLLKTLRDEELLDIHSRRAIESVD